MVADTLLVGFGRWGKNLARVLASLGRLGWVCDTDAERLEACRVWCGGDGVRLASSLEEVLESGDQALRYAVVATPIEDHRTTARACLCAGLHTFVEKPLCTTSAEIQELGLFAEREGLVLAVDHIVEFHPLFRTMCTTVSAYRRRVGYERAIWGVGQHLESIQAVRINTRCPAPRRGSILHDLGVHDVGLVLRLIEEAQGALPAEIEVTCVRSTPDDAPEEEVECVLRWVDASTRRERSAGIVLGRWDNDALKVRTLEVHSPRLSVFFEDGAHATLALLDRETQTDIDLPKRDGEPLLLALRAFFEHAEGDPSHNPLPNNALHALRVALLLEACDTSRHLSKTPIRVSIPSHLKRALP